MGEVSWPTPEELQLNAIRKTVSEMSGRGVEEVQIAISPYRICPLGAHIDHQGGAVLAMTIDKGILLGFVPSGDTQVVLRSGQFKGEVRFRVDETQHPRHSVGKKGEILADDSSKLQEECNWGNYARGALYALTSRGNKITQGIIGYISGSEGLDSSGLSSSAAVGIAYLLALESANHLTVSLTENIEYDWYIENEYLGLRNCILDQSAILLSSQGCLTFMNCKEHKLVHPPKLPKTHKTESQKAYKILLAFSGLKQALTTNPGYNRGVAECQEAARIILNASGNNKMEPILSNVQPEDYEAHKSQLEPYLAKRAEHYFSENKRVIKGAEAWASGKLEDFGKLVSASGLSSISKYESGCEPLIQLYEILLRAPGVFGTRFSGAGFRGCCLAFVDADRADEAASFIREEYRKVQPKLASQINDKEVMICEAGDCARVI
ncbi:galacturonokinase isoform X13 [Quercus robur]|uniref:galacturonokinase isoform X12 n=1 Tax=Quercus robur TaxID=38942 RepID=UPI00216127D6|nr:galacturonokinase isoform X12 [Quercus robur]XP_050260905.1 galacturonokinase isoform X13 [Quercus robur]